MTIMPDAQLAKAAATVGRVAAFLDSHRTERLDPAVSSAADTVRDAASALAALVRARLPDGARAGTPDVANAPTGSLDHERLTRFATYLGDLRRWFTELGEIGLSPPTVMHLEDLLGALQTIQDAVASFAAAEAHVPVEAVHHRPARPPAPGADEPESAVSGRMVFHHTPERPLLRESGRQAELTDDAKQLVAAFLAEHGLEGEAARHRLESRMLRWLEATPTGQVLVLKMGALTGRPEPYPTYMAPDLAYGRTADDDETEPDD
jgi:hypothetical protein